MTSTTTPDNSIAPTPAAADPPLTRADYVRLMQRLETIEQRSVRTESKVMRLLGHHGLDGHGRPVNEEQAQCTSQSKL